MTSHLHYKLTCCTDSPRLPGVDPPPARSKHALSLLMMRRHTPFHQERASRHCRNSSSGSSTNGAPFRSTFSRKKGDAPSRAELPSRRSFDAPKPVPRNPGKVKHFAMFEENHLDPLKKKRRATADPPDGRVPPVGHGHPSGKAKNHIGFKYHSRLRSSSPINWRDKAKNATKAYRPRDFNGASAASIANPPWKGSRTFMITTPIETLRCT